MRISLNWLRELVEVTLSPQELAQTLTVAGFEVEDIIDRRTLADGVVVGKVLDVQPHPNADKLRVCQVDIGQERPSNIVCGASNVRPEIFVPVATPGTYLPTIDLKLRSAKLRGVRSEGMICSLAELGLEKESEGIYLFPQENLTLGADVRPLLGLDDVILDLTSTANRADALSMVGVAREVAALTGGSLNLPSAPKLSIPEGEQTLQVQVADSKATPAYIGTIIANVKIAPSPDWLQWRLEAAGVRPINNVVDVTNYILLEWGQPLHAFDWDRLQNFTQSQALTIGVRYAIQNETLKTLDEQTRQLQTANLLITANDKPVALAGVMGGAETEVSENTENLLLEAALFDPVAIRRSSRAQGLRTEASARYERGVNQAELDLACARAIALFQELAAGTPISQEIADARPDKASWTRNIELRLNRVHQILGKVNSSDKIEDIPAADVERILTALGCELTTTAATPPTWQVKVPPYRYRDLEREIDLIEEVARLYGYDRFCDTLPSKTEAGYLSDRQQMKNKLREALRAVGLTEVVQYSLVKPELAEIKLANPLFAEYSALRQELLHGLIDAFAYNQSQGNGGLNAFEIGRIFWREKEKIQETDAIAGIMGGSFLTGNRWLHGGKESTMTWFEAKGLLESVFSRLGLKVEYQPNSEDSRLHPGRTASLWLDGKRLGTFGQLHPQLRQERNLPDEVYVFNLISEVIFAAMKQENILVPRFQAYSSYPAVERDLAFFAPIQLSVAEIEKSMQKAAGKLLEKIELFDEYRGENVTAGQRSLAFSLSYRSGDRTLTDAEVEPVHNKVREALTDKFDVTLRS
ncbi:MAG: phenylalanine--tRNA ligase subunit beta [Oscillatoria sp. PMC 1068.18]|nr:phenylalanine--tRNA ligase subunit beta [Oscillatoria sp. PMC 1076.18]MEC4988311.1 phenylalanine--tRNA ligase subunit beta [Oscillatoria sp. PMC 1068.18]